MLRVRAESRHVRVRSGSVRVRASTRVGVGVKDVVRDLTEIRNPG